MLGNGQRLGSYTLYLGDDIWKFPEWSRFGTLAGLWSLRDGGQADGI
jgi:hypothetical protein